MIDFTILGETAKLKNNLSQIALQNLTTINTFLRKTIPFIKLLQKFKKNSIFMLTNPL